MCVVEDASPQKRHSSGFDTIDEGTPEQLRSRAFNNHHDVVSRGTAQRGEGMPKRRVIRNGKLSQSLDFRGDQKPKTATARGVSLRGSLNTAQTRRKSRQLSQAIEADSVVQDHLNMDAVDGETILSSARPEQ